MGGRDLLRTKGHIKEKLRKKQLGTIEKNNEKPKKEQ